MSVSAVSDNTFLTRHRALDFLTESPAYVPLDIKMSFLKRFSQPITQQGTEETKVS